MARAQLCQLATQKGQFDKYMNYMALDEIVDGRLSYWGCLAMVIANHTDMVRNITTLAKYRSCLRSPWQI
jgi:hypothetical protein